MSPILTLKLIAMTTSLERRERRVRSVNYVGWSRGTAVERQSLAGEPFLSCPVLNYQLYMVYLV